ncbi:sugar-binding transcriptional regulator [Phytohabitans aurantiacus]|uniref:DNA-binding transcriptional regulator n=1 Tax=Phytohabitans aurantiacus TaxID=3016789 RepID=A0ABQ5R7X5_9ACTN|nr:sugar-binding domain-containing protein [Phytohabitans aurantiacus]GLI02864.1 DNA-binding transcriptional regulator [Phytohabitans aurantiacus]
MDELATDHIRLLTKVARMYHERGVRQPQIAQQLHISQPRVSRLLKRAVELGIVRTTVVTPRGVYAELEERIEEEYGLTEVIVADTDDHADENQILRALGAAAAVYLETTLMGGERIGVSSWSATILATVEAMRPRPTRVAEQVVQMLGGVGNVTAQNHATRIAGRLAAVTGAQAVYLPAPGLLASGDMRQMFVSDPNIEPALRACDGLTMALVGVGSIEPSPLLRESGNAFAESELPALREAGAVGDVCVRFFDEKGQHIESTFDDRVLGISAAKLRAVPRRVAVAGGARKSTAIRAALSGGWVNVLITDLQVARSLI